MYNSIIKIVCLGLIAAATSAELAPLTEDDLNQVSGQAGITISARAELASGTRVSFSNENIQADHYDASGNYIEPDYDSEGRQLKTGKPPANWLVVDDITGAIELSNLDIDVISGVGPDSDKTALQVTLPDFIDVDSLKTRGLYLGNTPEVSYVDKDDPVSDSSSHLFLLGLEIDGRLSMPANTKVNIFPVEQ